MTQDYVDAPVNPGRRSMFRKLAKVADPNVPQRAPWRRVNEIGAGDGNVLWSGWSNESNVFIVGDEGAVLHFSADRGSWQPMEVPTRLPLHAICGPDPSNLIAVGWMGSVLHFDGERWQQVRGGVVDPQTQSFANSPENTPLFGLTGDESGRAWAVGDDGMVLALQDGAWQQQSAPTQVNLRDIALSPQGRLFAAGAEGTIITSLGDGSWEKMDCPVAAGFTSVLALSEDEVLFGGGRYFVDEGRFCGELVRWHNGQFTVIDIAKDLPRIRALRAYKDGVLIAADQGRLYFMQGNRIDQLHTDSPHDLMDIIPLSSGEALVVGDFFTVMTAADDFTSAVVKPNSTPTIQAQWRRMESNTHHNLWGMCSGPQGSVYAGGDGGTVLQYRDNSWHKLPAVSAASVHCLWHDGADSLYAAGAMGQIHRYDGSNWQLVFDLYLDITILAMWGDGPDSIFAVGDEGLILHWDGSRWQRMISGTKSALYSVWGYDSAHVLAVGDFGLILRWNGESWAEFYAGTDNFLFDVWGDALDNIYIVGLSGTLSHFDGTRWNLTPARARDDIMAIDGRAGQGLYAVGAQGTVLRHEENQWKLEPTPVQQGLRAVQVCAGGDVFAVGNEGVILKRL